MKPKYYLVKLTIYAGAYEKHTVHLIQAGNPIEAGSLAMENESHDPEMLTFNEDYDRAKDMGGEFVYEVHSVTEVEGDDLSTPEKYLAP